MPFKAQLFQENVERWVEGAARDQLLQACQVYQTLTTPQSKIRCIQGMMRALDQNVNAETRRQMMETCGRHCIGASTLEKARRLLRDAPDLDSWLDRLNEAHIGGGHLRREGDSIHAAYDRCYCGSVSQAKERISDTYCRCSCGWYRQLFETLLGRPIEVELVSSIISGGERCQFLILLRNSDRLLSLNLPSRDHSRS